MGVCLATSGPGGLHLLNGLYDAKLGGQPVVAITGMPFHDLIGTHTQQDVELDKVFMDVAKYSVRVMGPTHVENVAHLACRAALLYRGVAHITFPVDLQEREINGEPSKRNVAGHNPEYGCDLQPIDFAAFARACGATGFSGADPAQCGDVLDRAFAAPGPAIVEAIVDPFEPPPKITVEQATKFAESLAKGQPHRNKIALTVLADKTRELV